MRGEALARPLLGSAALLAGIALLYLAARAVLAKNGVETEVVYPACCGMPQLEQGDLAQVAKSARKADRIDRR